MNGITVDTSQLDQLARRLAQAKTNAYKGALAAVKKGAQNTKTAIQADLKGSSHPGIRRVLIRYEMHASATRIEADIAPIATGRHREHGHTGPTVAAIAFFGTARGGGTHKFYEHGEQKLDATARHVHKAAMEAILP